MEWTLKQLWPNPLHFTDEKIGTQSRRDFGGVINRTLTSYAETSWLIRPGHLVHTPSLSHETHGIHLWVDWADLKVTLWPWKGSKLTAPLGVQPMAGDVNTKIQTWGWNVSRPYPRALCCQSRCVLVMQVRLYKEVVICGLWNQTDLAQNSSHSLLIITGIKTTSTVV